jgi:large subunit ribosomal protein L25
MPLFRNFSKIRLTDRISHIDFLELRDDKNVKVNLPVRLKGVSPGVISGGKLQQVFRKSTVCRSSKRLPADITLDIYSIGNW